MPAGLTFRLLVAIFFFYVGLRKFTPAGPWLVLFDQLSAPQWFRHLNGLLQIAGAALLLIPRTVLIGVWFLGCTMLAAMVTWLAVLHEPGHALLAGIILAMLIALAVFHLKAETIT